MSTKISQSHLQRAAYVYVRQSTGSQVRHHQESGRRQYGLAERAQALGFAPVVIIDDDGGRSGSGLQERPGFGQLLTAVCEGKLGAVFALEASRLARNNRDWHHLIDLCALTDTLLIDDEGIYDPRQLNDRLVLGMQGSMAEYELGLMRQRARHAFEEKIRRGHWMWEVPVGFVRTDDNRIAKTPDLQGQHAITGVLQQFRELGSARQATLWYRDAQLPLPEVQPATAGREIIWRLPTGHRINQSLINPCYAGALAYGHTEAKTVLEDGRARQTSRRKKPRDQWRILRLDNHPGYLSWDEFVANREQLETNRAMPQDGAGGAAKRGAALLSGLLRCGHCGRKLNVGYSGSDGRLPRYICKGGRIDRGSSSWLSRGGRRGDQAVEAVVLEALQPAGVQASLDARDRLMAEHDTKRQALELALEKAQYDVHHARRQYDRVDPDYRLVARELERRWNDALQRVVEVEIQLTTLKSQQITLSDEHRQRLLTLGHDLKTVWHHEAAAVDLKKRILRTVLHEIIITRTAEPPEYRLHLHWQGGVHTELRVARTMPGKHSRAPATHILDLIREFSKVCRDATAAATLNRLGYRTGTGKTWRAHSIASVRYQYRLPNFVKGKDWLTLKQAAARLKVSETVVNRLITQGSLPASQAVPLAPWVIRRADLDLRAVQSEVQAAQARGLRSKNRDPVPPDVGLETSDVTWGEQPTAATRSDAPPGA
jgi:DNA invertase Pin-like site-specific DNA recombinase